MLEIEDGRVLLIHHWDTDGLCSAALLLDYLGRDDIVTWTPLLGTFYLLPKHIEMAQDYDHVIVCDMALPSDNIRAIAKKTRVTVIDHHHQDPIEEIEHINPVAYGASGDQYPSNTWVIKEKLELSLSLKIILGYVGDREQKIKDNPPFWKQTQEYLAQEGIMFDDLLELVYRIDSGYKVGEREAVMQAPRQLRTYETRKDILANKEWKENLRKLEEKLEKVLSEPPEVIDGVQVKRLDTPFAIISQVTRKLAWGTGKDTVVVNTGFFPDQDQLYSRSNIVDMHRLIENAKKYGYNAGGKKDVIGAIIPKSDTERFLAETIEYIKENR
ncbi:MAG: DHH family phosphoesterase [Candidatus Bathyarchaeota archaeon]|nr:DHH family phosphoesterase [Candidatus Bathyarchaeota archaeon]